MPTKHAIVKQVEGVTLVGKSDTNHWVVMDGKPEFGGHNAGSSPKELLLMALGGCTANDVIPILAKKKVKYDNFEVRLTANVREEHPQIYTDIHIEYIFYGDAINPVDVERAIELSTTKYCSISAMLKAAVKITHAYRIIPTQAVSTQEESITKN